MSDLETRATAVANRMRLAQMELADADTDEREQVIEREIKSSLAELAPAQRKEFLDRLAGKFPTWELKVSRAEALPETATAPPPEWDDWRFVLDHLTDIAKKLPTEERKKLVARITKKGLAPRPARSGWPEGIDERLRQLLDVPKDSSLSADRALVLLPHLVDMATKLEVAWNIWDELSAGSTRVRRPGNLSQATRNYLSATDDTLPTEHLKWLRLLILGFVNSPGVFPGSVVDKYRHLMPKEIQKHEKGLLESTRKARWWDAYEKRAWRDPDKVIGELRGIVADTVEALVTGW